MKKVLLFSLIIGFALSTIAQNGMVSKKNEKRVQDGQEVAVERPNPVPMPELKNGDAVNEDMARIYVGMAGHERGIRREEAHVVSYNYDLDVISVTSILDPATYDNVDELGIAGAWYSADHGQTWTGPVILNDNLEIGPNYYLSGAMYNPEGNTTMDNMFGVHQGTIYPNTNPDWAYKAFGSSTIGGDYLTTLIDEGSEYNGYWNIYGLNQFGNEMRCLNLKTVGTWSAFTSMELQFITGEFNGEGFDWNFDNLLDANFNVESDGTILWTGMYVSYDSGAEIAWSNDGEIGYAWVVGRSNEDPSGYQPIVFKTVNGGEDWDYIFLDFQDGDIQDIIEPYVIEVSWIPGLMIPNVKESAGVVDANGDLQMMMAVASHSADALTYPDSLGWSYTNEPGNLFSMTVNDDGIAELMWVDALITESVAQDDPGNYCGTEGWQRRISAAKNQDETQWFFTWIDTRDTSQTINLKPDLFGWSKSIDGYNTPDPICFSEGTELEENFYFNTGSDKAYYNMDEHKYVIPYVQGVTPLEFLINTSSSGDPITLSYVTGVEFPAFVGIDEFASTNGISVSQNTPNPFNGSTAIEVSTKTASLVTVEVSNIMGQLIYTVNAGIVNGTQKIELSSKDLETGIYLYTVNVGSESVTKKMIVE